MPSRTCRIAALAAAVLSIPAAVRAQQPGQGYHVARQVKLGGEGGWDYLLADPATHRLFITRGSHVMVVDMRSDSLVADIQNTPGVHGVAIAPDLGRGFTSNGRDTSVTVFDLTSLKPLMNVKVTGRNPDAITYDPVSRRVFTFNGGGANTTAIDAVTGAIAGTVDLGGKPEFPQTDGRGHLYVNNEDKSEIIALDTRSLAVFGHWPLGSCEAPTGLAFDRERRRLFSVCGNRTMVVVNADEGQVVATVPIGSGVDGVVYDPGSRLIFTSNGEGTMTVVRQEAPDRYSVVQTVPTLRGARTLTLDPVTHRVYTVTAEFGPVPAPTAEQPRPRAPMIPGSFMLLVVEP